MENIVFEHIETKSSEYKFCRCVYGDPDDPSSFKLIIMTGNTGEYAKYNGYVNGPKMYAQALTRNGKPKLFDNWLGTKGAKQKIDALEKILPIETPSTIEISIGGTETNNLLSGTYIHPKLIIHVACSMSIDFAFKISDWIEEWRSWSSKNELLFWKELSNCRGYHPNYNNKEQQIQEELQSVLENAQLEVETPVGIIDILTDTQIIEIKEARKWKHALGQILSYGKFYPEHQKVIYLFDHEVMDISMIKNVVSDFDIEVRLH